MSVTADATGADWIVANVAQDTSVDPFTFGPLVNASPQTTVTSNGGPPVVLAGFTGTLDLTLSTTTVPAGEGGATITVGAATTEHVFDASGEITVPVTSGAQVTLWLDAPATIAQRREIQASIGDPATLATW